MMSEAFKKNVVKKDNPGFFKDTFLFYFEGLPNWDLENQEFSFEMFFWVL